METLDYWSPADCLASRCSVAEVGTLRPQEPQRAPQMALGGREDVRLAREHVPRAIRALVRVMEGDNPRAALDAAKELLSRAYGPALPQTGETALPGMAQPDWLTSQRHAYKAGDYVDSPCLPEH